MPEAVVDQPTGSETQTGNQQTQSPGWLAGLPADLRDNEAFKSYRTVGDFAKDYLAVKTKATEYEGKLANSIPKLGENATQEERDKFQIALGKPEKAEDYELDGEDRFTPEGKQSWKKEFHELGLPKSTAKELSARINRRLDAMVERFKADNDRQVQEAATKLKGELGDRYDASVELASRLWKRDVDGDLEKDFQAATGPIKFSIIRYILKMAAKTGEDMSQPGSGSRQTAPSGKTMDYSKSNMPPPRA